MSDARVSGRSCTGDGCYNGDLLFYMPDAQPYLSVVAAARNDDHGVNMLSRLQTFVNCLIGQAKRHVLPVELILVEWNPPPDRPPLSQALRWPSDLGPCTVRILQVPNELHRRYRHADAQPLYQMVGKNAGIRRAAGEYILATNIDILLSDELMEFLAARRLQSGAMYRIDRHDVDSAVPVDAPVEEQLAYCRTHLLRVNAKEGTFALTPEGFRRPAPVDIVRPDAGIFPGSGWSAPVQSLGQISRRVALQSRLDLRPAPADRVLLLEVAPAEGEAVLQYDSAEVCIAGRSQVRLRISSGADRVDLRVTGPLLAFRCDWDSSALTEPVTVRPAPARRLARAGKALSAAFRLFRDLRHGSPLRIPLPLPARWRRRFQVVPGAGVSLALGELSASAPWPGSGWANLHINASGDFALAHRRHWLDLRGYPEFDGYSMNLDAAFCYMSHYGGAAEQVLPEPMRIYHIEHSAGSGWSPEGQHLLFGRLRAKGVPWVEIDDVVGWAAQMERFETTMIFNRDNWGLGDFELPEEKI